MLDCDEMHEKFITFVFLNHGKSFTAFSEMRRKRKWFCFLRGSVGSGKACQSSKSMK